MKAWIAVVSDSGGKVTKFQDFDTEAEANAHVSTHGGFTAANPGGALAYWTVSGTTLSYDDTTDDADALAAAKKLKNNEIDAKRDELLTAGKTIRGNDYDGRLTTMGAIVAKRDRIGRNGGAAVSSITAINTSTDTVTVSGGAPADGNEVQFAGIGGTTELNGNVYFSANKSGDNFTLTDRLGNAVDMSGFGTYTSGGTATVAVTAIDVDNNLVAMSFDNFETLSDTLSAWHNDMYEQGRVHKNDVNALSSVSAVNAVNVSSLSWPS